MGEASSLPPVFQSPTPARMKQSSRQSVSASTQRDGCDDDEAMHWRELKLNVIFAVQGRLMPQVPIRVVQV